MFKSLFKRKPKYDLDTVEGIMSIPIPRYKKLNEMASPVENIEYILQRKATEYIRQGEIELALACLRKSNEIFPHSNFMWSMSDYLRLVEYLKKIRRFDEAREEKAKIEEIFSANETDRISMSWLEFAIMQAKGMNTDYIITGDNDCLCAECAMYTRRIYCISGKDKRFLKIPQRLFENSPGHSFCLTDYYPFFYPESAVTWNYRGNIIDWCNRPYADERTNQQKAVFRERVITQLQEALDRQNYDLIYEHLPEIAPKSFGGFRRMKNKKTTNYEKLKLAALPLCDIEAKPDTSDYKF